MSGVVPVGGVTCQPHGSNVCHRRQQEHAVRLDGQTGDIVDSGPYRCNVRDIRPSSCSLIPVARGLRPVLSTAVFCNPIPSSSLPF